MSLSFGSKLHFSSNIFCKICAGLAFLISNSKISFDFQVDATDRLGLNVYTVSMQGQDGDWITSTILAPTYGTALALAGMSQDNTIKISEIPFEG